MPSTRINDNDGISMLDEANVGRNSRLVFTDGSVTKGFAGFFLFCIFIFIYILLFTFVSINQFIFIPLIIRTFHDSKKKEKET